MIGIELDEVAVKGLWHNYRFVQEHDPERDTWEGFHVTGLRFSDQ